MNEKIWLNNVRSLACIMVLIVHVTAIYKYSYGAIDTVYWYFAVILDSASRMCVPLFFMISGYLFLQGKNVKIKNLIKIFSALTFYSLLSVIYWSLFHGRDFLSGLSQIYTKPALYHLWFMFYIFSFYILFMFMSARNVEPKKGICVIASVFIILNFNLNELFQFFGINYRNNFVITSYHLQLLFYCFAGVFIGNIKENQRFFKTAITLCTLSIMIIFALTIDKSIESNKLNPLFQGYTSIPVFISSTTMFYILKCYGERPIFGRLTKTISSYSLAIYGVHAIYLEIIRTKKIFLFDNPVLNLLSTILIVFSLSYLTAYLIRFFDKNGYVS